MAYSYDVEAIREAEYPMMKGTSRPYPVPLSTAANVRLGSMYLDHGGTTIYAKSLIERFSKDMISNLYGNPHSASNPAQLSGHKVDEIREKTLHFFGADPKHFDLIFTANATASMKLVADTFRDLAASSSTSGAFWYGYHKDAHTSLVGIREFTKNHHCFTCDEEVDAWLEHGRDHGHSADMPALFAFPGQSNMTGRRLPLSWPGRLRQSLSTNHRNTWSLLDAAALATTAPLDFSDPDTAPDFTALSFYKVFGFPDLGGLIVRRQSGHILAWRKYFGGGTVDMVTVIYEATFQRKTASIHDGCEDGTVAFHSIIALGSAIDVHRQLYGPDCMKAISAHTSSLIRRLYTGLSGLRHSNGRPVCVIYNEQSRSSFSDSSSGCTVDHERSAHPRSEPKSRGCLMHAEGVLHPYSDPKTAGATIAFNMLRPDGSILPHNMVEDLANVHKIYIRAGGLCNPGGVVTHLQIEPWQMKGAWSGGFRCSGDNIPMHGKTLGVARASLGAMTNTRDIDALISFVGRKFGDYGAREPLANVVGNVRNPQGRDSRKHQNEKIEQDEARKRYVSAKTPVVSSKRIDGPDLPNYTQFADIFEGLGNTTIQQDFNQAETKSDFESRGEVEQRAILRGEAGLRRLTSQLSIKRGMYQAEKSTLADADDKHADREHSKTLAMQNAFDISQHLDSTDDLVGKADVESPPTTCTPLLKTFRSTSSRMFHLGSGSNTSSDADVSYATSTTLGEDKRRSMKFWKRRAD